MLSHISILIECHWRTCSDSWLSKVISLCTWATQMRSHCLLSLHALELWNFKSGSKATIVIFVKCKFVRTLTYRKKISLFLLFAIILHFQERKTLYILFLQVVITNNVGTLLNVVQWGHFLTNTVILEQLERLKFASLNINCCGICKLNLWFFFCFVFLFHRFKTEHFSFPVSQSLDDWSAASVSLLGCAD